MIQGLGYQLRIGHKDFGYPESPLKLRKVDSLPRLCAGLRVVRLCFDVLSVFSAHAPLFRSIVSRLCSQIHKRYA